MSCAANPARPPFITCTCGRTVPVKRFGPIPVMCHACADSRHASQVAAWHARQKTGGAFVDQLGALEGAEELEDGRKRLGCQLEHFRAQVAALARDIGLRMPRARQPA